MTGDRRTPTLRADLIAGAIYALVFAFLVLGPGQRLFYGMDAAYFDRLARQQAGTPDNAITIVAIDEQSVRNIGRVPFSRDVVASVIDTLAAGGARTVVSTLAFSEPQVDAGADYLRDLDRTLASLDADPTTLDALKAQVSSAINAIDYDRKLADSIDNAGNVLLPVLPNDRVTGSSVLA
ncbi:MAG: CHASE2 domain-containing protein, partial [Pseudomonadota bacterium]